MRLIVVLRPGVSRPSVLLSHIPGTSQTLRCKKPTLFKFLLPKSPKCFNDFSLRTLVGAIGIEYWKGIYNNLRNKVENLSWVRRTQVFCEGITPHSHFQGPITRSSGSESWD
jgi:hypothetical protein